VNLKSPTTTPNKEKKDDDLFALVDVKKENKDLLLELKEDKKQLLNIEEYLAQQKESADKEDDNLFN
jgi:hypothetical protein